MSEILLITSTRIGDAVLSTGVLRSLVETDPGARLTIACGPLPAPLFRAVPGLREVIVMEKRRRGGHWFELRNRAKGRRYDLAIDLRGSLVTWLLSARERRIWRRGAFDRGDGKAHELARAAGLPHSPPLKIWTDEAAEHAAREAVGHNGPFLALGHGANWIGKQWAAERFADAALALTGPNGPCAGWPIVLFGGPADAGAAQRLTTLIAGVTGRRTVIDATGGLDLLAAFAALRRAGLFIGCDSGLMHMAAAAGVPTLGLFGPSDERVYGPFGPKARAVRQGRSFEVLRAIDPALNGPASLMGDLEAQTVITAAQSLLAASS